MGRSIGLDVHRDFCPVAIADGGRARSAGKVAATPEQLEPFAQSLAPDDRVVMEATGNALAIARILEGHVAAVVLAHAKQVRADRIALLAQAASTLAASPARLQHARTLVNLGAALRAAGRRTEAQEQLRAGLDLAARCGATRLQHCAHAELVTAGARPRAACS